MPLYFIAILAPETIHQRVTAWKEYMKQHFGCKAALRSPVHITLAPPFNMLAEKEQELVNALDIFTQRQSPFEIHLQNFEAFKPRVIYVQVLPAAPLLQLKQELEYDLLTANRFPLKKEERPFHPHITIATRDLKKEDFPAAWQHFQTLLYEVSFSANSLSLLRNSANGWEVIVTSRFGALL